ncbi:MAG: 16S rRNA (guanine(966)-N(2))-methyltransferase RsmD [Betaproteobacteria bacterium]
MRVTGGIGRGRRLKVPSGSRVRPTSDKVKQALFNILGDRVANADFLDLYAGAGGIGIEALSRGAGRVVFVDSSRGSLAVIKQNIEQTGFRDRAQVVPAKAEAFVRKSSESYDIVFLDPPYAEEMQPLLELVAGSGIVKPDGVVVAEHFKKQPSPEKAGSLTLYREARYGDTVLAFYKNMSVQMVDVKG